MGQTGSYVKSHNYQVVDFKHHCYSNLTVLLSYQQLSERSSSSTNGGELSFPNGLCVGMDETVVPVTMSQVLWQITQSSMALADYKVK